MSAPVGGPGGVGGMGRIPGMPGTTPRAADTPAERLERSAQLLESEFLNTLFRVMRETVPEEDSGAGQATEIFWSMLDREIADQTALGGGYGLGEAIHRQLAPEGGDK